MVFLNCLMLLFLHYYLFATITFSSLIYKLTKIYVTNEKYENSLSINESIEMYKI